MSTQIEIMTNADFFLKLLEKMPEIEKAATADAINKTAFQSRKKLIADIEKRFILRRPWTVKGMLVEKAKKNKLIGEVGSIRSYMRDQALKRPQTGRQRIPGLSGAQVAIPAVGDKRPRPTKTKALTKGKQARTLVTKKIKNMPFVVKLKSGQSAVFQKVANLRKKQRGKGKTRPRYPIKFLYTLTRKVSLKIKWPMEDINEVVISANFDKNYAEKLQEQVNKTTAGMSKKMKKVG